jgi:hypothetical protein
MDSNNKKKNIKKLASAFSTAAILKPLIYPYFQPDPNKKNQRFFLAVPLPLTKKPGAPPPSRSEGGGVFKEIFL